jgi:segregation and condensation protein B
MQLDSSLEAILFFKSEPISVKKLALLLDTSEEEIGAALSTLKEKLSERGIRLIQNGEEVMLGTAPEMSPLIEKITKEELTRDIGKAGLEILSIILYRGPISRREIDYIRGVNSSFMVRNLLIRGLIEKTESKEGERSFSYKPTFELLSFLGVTKVEDLPEFEEVKKEIQEFNKKQETEDQAYRHE